MADRFLARWAPFLLLVMAALLFVNNIRGYDLWPPDEPRFAEVAREMLLSGDPVTLHVNGEYYKEKPPLLFWLISAASLPGADQITSFTARIPSVVAGVVAVWLTYLLARRLFDRWTALWAGLMLATSALFWWEARSVRTDMLLTAGTTASLYFFWRWHEDRRTNWLVAFYIAIAIALLAKGPPALVFPLLLIAAFYWKQRPERRRLHWVLGVLLAVVPVLIWFVLSARGAPATPASLEDAQMGSNLFRQTIGRFFLGVSKAEPPWYFLQVLPGYLMPWTLFLPWTAWWTWRHRRDGAAMRLLLSWIVPAFVFFSISIGKRGVYLLPLYPAFAILFARSILDLMDSDRLTWRRRTAAVWAVLTGLLAVAPFFALRDSEYGPALRPLLLAATVVFAVFAVDAAWRAWRTTCRTLHAVLLVEFVVLLALGATFVFPAINPYKSAREITAPLRELSRAGTDYRVYSLGFSREEYIFYAEHFHKPVLTDLLPLELPEELDLKEMATLQRRVKKAMMEAVEAVPVADWNAVTPEELERLQGAVHAAVAEAEVDPASAAAFERGLAEAVAAFAAEFESGGPAFFFVQEEDWRWLLALHPHLADYRVVKRQGVGSRDVLLVANNAGMTKLSFSSL